MDALPAQELKHGDGFGAAAFKVTRDRTLAGDPGADGSEFVFPIGRSGACEPVARVLQEEWLDVVDAVQHLAVDRLASERGDRPGDDVGEPPAELAEGGGVARRRQRV